MKKAIVIALAVLVGLPLLLVVLAGTPPVLSGVARRIERAVQESTGIPLTIGSLQGHLLFTLRAENIVSHGMGRIDALTLTYNPIGLLKRRVDIGSVLVQGIELDIDRLISTIEDLPEKDRGQQKETEPFVIRIAEFSISDGSMDAPLADSLVTVTLDARGKVTGDRMTIDSLHLTAGGSEAVASGIIPFTRSVDLDIAYIISLALADMGSGPAQGNLITTGTLSGSYAGPLVAARTQVDILLPFGDVTGSVRSRWRIPFVDSLSIEADLKAVIAVLGRLDPGAESLDVDIVLKKGEGSATIQSNRGTLDIDGRFTGIPGRPAFEGSISGHFDLDGFDPSVQGSVSLRDDVLSIEDMKVRSSALSSIIDLRADLRRRVFSEARVTLSCDDLSIVPLLFSLPGEMSGELHAGLNVKGSFDDPEADARVTLSGVHLYEEEIKAADLSFHLESGNVSLDQGTIETGRGDLSITGAYDRRRSWFNARLIADRISIAPSRISDGDPLPVSGDVALDLDLSGYVENPNGTGHVLLRNVIVDSTDIGDYRLDLALLDTTVTVSLVKETGDLMVTGEVQLAGQYSYDAILRLDHFELDEYLAPAGGFVSGEISARGELAEAQGSEGVMRIDTLFLTHGQESAQNLYPLVVRLQERSIDIEDGEVSVSGQKISFGGSMCLDLRSRRFDLWARSPMIDLSHVAHLLPTDPSIAGSLAFEVRLLGTERIMDIDGRVSLSGGRFEADHVLVDSVDGLLAFRDGVLTIETLKGRINSGRFAIKGIADLARGILDTLFVNTDLDGAVFADKSFGRAVLGARMEVSGKKDSLRIDGEITVEEGIYDAPIRLQTIVGMLTKANRPVPERSDLLKRIYCDIGISVPDSLRIHNNVAELTAMADLEVKGYLARPNAYGTITAVGEGSVQYLGKKFTIVNAVIQFDDPYKIDPIIDLAATASVSAADGEYDIYLFLNGTVTTWQLRLSSNPPVPEQDIISLLLIGQRRPGEVTGLAGDVDLKGKARDYALDAVRQGLERRTQDLLHLDKFTLSGDLSDPSTVRVGIEKSVARGFRLIYTTGVESWELHQIGAVYDLTDHISVFTLHDQENLNTSADLDFHLEIK